MRFYLDYSSIHDDSWNSPDNVLSKLDPRDCFAHAVHRFAEGIRNEFLGVNKVISAVKKVFRKHTIANT